MAVDIVVLLAPILLGENSLVATQVVERLHGNPGLLNNAGLYACYGRTAGVPVTGNEDGAKDWAMNLLYSLQRLAYTIPSQADAAWRGPIGPGPSYTDEGSGGPESDFTDRSSTLLI